MNEKWAWIPDWHGADWLLIPIYPIFLFNQLWHRYDRKRYAKQRKEWEDENERLMQTRIEDNKKEYAEERLNSEGELNRKFRHIVYEREDEDTASILWKLFMAKEPQGGEKRMKILDEEYEKSPKMLIFDADIYCPDNPEFDPIRFNRYREHEFLLMKLEFQHRWLELLDHYMDAWIDDIMQRE